MKVALNRPFPTLLFSLLFFCNVLFQGHYENGRVPDKAIMISYRWSLKSFWAFAWWQLKSKWMACLTKWNEMNWCSRGEQMETGLRILFGTRQNATNVTEGKHACPSCWLFLPDYQMWLWSLWICLWIVCQRPNPGGKVEEFLNKKLFSTIGSMVMPSHCLSCFSTFQTNFWKVKAKGVVYSK